MRYSFRNMNNASCDASCAASFAAPMSRMFAVLLGIAVAMSFFVILLPVLGVLNLRVLGILLLAALIILLPRAAQDRRKNRNG